MEKRTCDVPACGKPHRARGLCGVHYNATHQTKAQHNRPRSVECAACGKPMTTTSSPKYDRNACSYECRATLQFPGRVTAIPQNHPAHPRWAGKLLPVVWRAPLPRPQQSKPPAIRWVAGRCQRCGDAFIDVWLAERSAIYCSNACARKMGKARHRARKKDAYVADVSPRRIYERDGWRCQLCKKPVLRDEVVPHPLAPTIDHRVPLAAGGTHEPANAQCAHYICNSRKGARCGDTQLLLFG